MRRRMREDALKAQKQKELEKQPTVPETF
jgi:hypothetical protein